MHNKQFIITKRQIMLPDFYKENLGDSLYLYYHNELHIEKGLNTFLLGHAFQGDIERRDPDKIIKEDIKSPINEYKSWDGRWVLICNNEIHPDACAQLAVFYGNIGDELVISSSLSLIAQIYAGEYTVRDHFPLEYNFLLSWQPGPLTIMNGIRRMLPTQYLSIDEQVPKICFRDPINQYDMSGLSDIEIYSRILNYQKNIFRKIVHYDFAKGKYDANIDNKIEIGLTAGYDSRLQAAMLKSAGINFSTHTFEREKSTAYADNNYPEIIADILSVGWRYIKQKKRNVTRVMEYNKHTFDSVKDRDWKWHYPCGQFDELDGNVFVSNSIWEAFCNYYSSFGLNANMDDSKQIKLEDLVKVFPTLEGNEFATDSFSEFIDWSEENKIEKLSWADRVAFEQLMGIWDANENLGIDLALKEMFHINPANSMYIFSLINALPCELRNERKWEKEMTNYLIPELQEVPYNINPSVDIRYYNMPWWKEIKDKKIIIYGAGKVGVSFYLQIQTRQSSNIVAWVDKRHNVYESMGLKIDNPMEIKDKKYDYILIAIENDEIRSEIKEYLVMMGVDEDKILWRFDI